MFNIQVNRKRNFGQISGSANSPSNCRIFSKIDCRDWVFRAILFCIPCLSLHVVVVKCHLNFSPGTQGKETKLFLPSDNINVYPVWTRKFYYRRQVLCLKNSIYRETNLVWDDRVTFFWSVLLWIFRKYLISPFLGT